VFKIASDHKRQTVDRQHNSNEFKKSVRPKKRLKRNGGKHLPTSAIHTKTGKWVTNALFSSGKSNSAGRNKRVRFKDQSRSDPARAGRLTASHQVVEAVVRVVGAVVRF
jgi:hypothetical protein